MVIPMRALDRKLLRDLWRMKGQVAAIGAVVAMGVMVLVMMSGLFVSIQETRRAYYESCRFADVFAPVKRAPRFLVDALAALPGVSAAEGRVVGEALIDLPGLELPVRGRALSLPDMEGAHLNGVRLVAGRLPDAGNADEILLLESFAAARGLGPGDRLTVTMNGARRSLRIVGLAQSPEFIYITAPGEVVSNDAQYGILWMGRRAIAAAYGMEGAFNEAILTLDRSARLAGVLDAVDRLLDPYGGTGSYGREHQHSNHFVSSELDQLRSMSVIMPPLFLIVAAFLLTLVVSRMVHSEREQIGLIKAFGYTDLAVGLHYFKMVVVIAALGAAAGCVLGVLAGRSLAGVYLLHFKFPSLTFRPDPRPFLMGFLVSIGSASAGGCFVLRRVFALTPASAMRPPAPPDYSRTGGLTRRLDARLDQPCRMVLRRLLRRPGRMIGAAAGIAFGMALSVGMIAILGSFDTTVSLTFDVFDRSNLAVAFNDAASDRTLHELRSLPGVIEAEPARSVPVILRHGLRDHHGTIDGLISPQRLNLALDAELRPIPLRAGGIVLGRTLANTLGVRAGNVLDVEVRTGRRPRLSLPVVGVAGTVMGAPAFMDLDSLNRALREPNRISGAWLRIDEAKASSIYRELKRMPTIAGVRIKRDSRVAFREQMDSGPGSMRYLILAIAGVVAFGVVYNAASIAYAERARDLASLRVMGFTRGETAFVLLGELAIVTLAALAGGAILGYGAFFLFAEAFSMELYQIPTNFTSASAGTGAAVVLGSAIVSGWLVKQIMDRADLVSVIKTRE